MSFAKRYTGLRGELGKYLLYGGDTKDFHLDQDYPRLEFKELIDSLQHNIDVFSKAKEDRLFAIDTVLRLLRQDLMFSCLSDGVYSGSEALFFALNIPRVYKDKYGNDVDLKDNKEPIEIDLTQTCTLVKPWSILHYITNVSDRNKTGKEFKYNESNHEVYYYPTLKIAMIENGNHSIADGVLNRSKAIVKAQKINDVLLLDSVCTDGAFWYNRYDGSYAGRLKNHQSEPRAIKNFLSLKFAVLFEVTQRRCKLFKGE